MAINTFQARMDIRGFLRFTEDLVSTLKLKSFSYADLWIDPVGGRVGITLAKKLKETSFRMLPSNDTYLLYLKGAMNVVDMPVKSGQIVLIKEGDKIILQGKKTTKKPGPWIPFACRNSAGLPMISIDTRGTLILDRRCIDALQTIENNTLTPAYDPKKKEFILTFSKNGLINVRTIESHASVSFMGTLSSYGIPLPSVRIRTSVSISGKTLTFKVTPLTLKVDR